MSAIPPILTAAAQNAHDQYVVSHGKAGALGVFTAETPLVLRRGQSVVIRTARGLEIGTVMCPASLQQARILGAVSAGTLIRPASDADQVLRAKLTEREQHIFDQSRTRAHHACLDLEIIDAEVLFDAQHAILQFLGNESGLESFALDLQACFGLTVHLENLNQPAEAEESHGCGKPDCGRSASSGGCSSCGTGGGCSTCGGAADMRDYFSHLRAKVDAHRRVPLV